jgi:hypothetical protein
VQKLLQLASHEAYWHVMSMESFLELTPPDLMVVSESGGVVCSLGTG